MPAPKASTALQRFTVLDLTRVRAGPTAVRQLADWGANVIKVELPEHLEPADSMGGPRHGPDFQNLHRNKRVDHARSEIGRGRRRVPPAGGQGRRGGREFPARREEAARHRLRAP